MRMGFRVFIAFWACVTLGALILKTERVVAQEGSALQVIPLSSSGYEEVHSLAYSSDGQYLSVGGISGIYIFDGKNLSLLNYLDTRVSARNVLFLPGSHTLAAGLFDNTIKLWNASKAQLSDTFLGHQGWVRKISVSKDGSLLASASDDDTLRIWRVADGKLLLTISQNTQGVRAVAISPDGQLVAGALRDHTVRVWRVADGSLLYTLVGHTDWARCLAFSPDGSLLASGSFDMNVHLWRMSDGSLERTLKGHTSSILELAFSPDGEMLASSAVDETVRLWRVRNGNSIHTFTGYAGFIYGLGFSPDGKTLASGSENQLYIWDLKILGIDSVSSVGIPSSQENVRSSTPDCRNCHHTRGQIEPPRVTYMRCEACHAQGASLLWCPSFPRAAQARHSFAGYIPSITASGLPSGNRDLAVLIASPANGETLYTENGLAAAAVVVGRVFAGDGALAEVRVQLEVWADGKNTVTLTATPVADGRFKFNLLVNPQGGLIITSSTHGYDCPSCHEDYRAQASLPNGTVRLLVTASDAAGNSASDERWVSVDTSGKASLPVRVVDAQTHAPIQGVSVSASTVLYEWRARYGTALSDSDGLASLELEALTQAPTSYQIVVPPQIINGVLYSSQPTQVELSPGATSHDMVTLTASAQTGQIVGSLTAPDTISLSGLQVKAVQLPAGPVYETMLSAQNSFTFDPLPVSQYLIAFDPASLAQKELAVSVASVDLIESPDASLSLNAAKSRPLAGTVTSESGDRVSFAWARIDDHGDSYFIDPATGGYLLTNLPRDANFITITAPGYYSQSQHISENQAALDIQLVPETETKKLSWGNGTITLPPETDASFQDLDVTLNSGWVWGKNSASQPLVIRAASAQIHLSDGEFAVERTPNHTAWLYLYQGQAQVQFASGQAPVEVRSGEMIALSEESAQPLPLNTSTALALHPNLSEPPLPENIQPALGARIGNWLEKIGIGVAQTVTFITYIFSLASLLAIPLFMVFWIKKHRKQ